MNNKTNMLGTFGAILSWGVIPLLSIAASIMCTVAGKRQQDDTIRKAVSEMMRNASSK